MILAAGHASVAVAYELGTVVLDLIASGAGILLGARLPRRRTSPHRSVREA